MKLNTKSKWSWLNPLCWFQQIYAFVAALFMDILKLFGRMPQPATDGLKTSRPSMLRMQPPVRSRRRPPWTPRFSN